MPGYVYACCSKGSYTHVKIGHTASEDPFKYCNTNYARVLVPLEIIVVQPFSDSYSAEQNVHRLLQDRRLMPKREVFDLSGKDGLLALKNALELASTIDKKGHTPCLKSVIDLTMADLRDSDIPSTHEQASMHFRTRCVEPSCNANFASNSGMLRHYREQHMRMVRCQIPNEKRKVQCCAAQPHLSAARCPSTQYHIWCKPHQNVARHLHDYQQLSDIGQKSHSNKAKSIEDDLSWKAKLMADQTYQVLQAECLANMSSFASSNLALSIST